MLNVPHYIDILDYYRIADMALMKSSGSRRCVSFGPGCFSASDEADAPPASGKEGVSTNGGTPKMMVHMVNMVNNAHKCP